MAKEWMRLVLAIGSAAALTACDQDATLQTSLATAPTRSAFVGRMASLPTVSIAAPVGFSCMPTTTVATSVNLVIVASTFIDVEQVTLRLIDGTHVGSSPITIPQAQLSAQFGSTRVQPGTTRVFAFQPQFLCGSLQPALFAADVVFLDATGARQTMTVSSSPVDGR